MLRKLRVNRISGGTAARDDDPAAADAHGPGAAARYRYCFVITHGRSGSTLLQGVLNRIPGYVIRGENGGVIQQMHAMVASLERNRAEYRSISRAPTDPWFGLDGVDPPKLMTDLRDLFVRNYLRPPEGTRCTGFKEIRYGPDRVPDLPGLLDFMDDLFPRACFVFNVRDLSRAASSGWWASRPDALAYLEQFQQRLADAYGRSRPNDFWLSYDEYGSDPSALQPLFAFLSEPFDLATVRATMSELHSSRTLRPGPE